MKTGIVKSYDDLNGFGIIMELASQKDFYVREDGLKESIKENDEVTFELEEGENGLHAIDIRQA
jgi:cold shock protein